MTTNRLNTVKLDLLRAGPVHGQPLAPLTPYLALCGDEGPVTFNVPFEHYRFVNRLKRLRYISKDGSIVPDPTRQTELEELGRDVGKLFGGIPTLTSELGRAAACEESNLVHLRIVITGSELSIIPFEAMVSPQGYPGEGLPLALQTRVPVTMTREVRRGKTPRYVWDREPKVLFVSASPKGFEVPAREHLHAVRGALETWIRWHTNEKERLAYVKERLTVLLNASLSEIEQACVAHQFTHVHILAHGVPIRQDDGDLRFGIALCDPNDRTKRVDVDGHKLAAALTRLHADGTRSTPTVVTLATCDSGNAGEILAPGGSIAHTLQAFGVPWVFASQFPLTKRGSVRMAEMLYEGLLVGDDPRIVLRRLRESLHINAQSDHDWASVVGYITLQDGLEAEIDRLWIRHQRAAFDRDMERADDFKEQWQKANDAGDAPKAKVLLEQVNRCLKDADGRFCGWDKRLGTEAQRTEQALSAMCLGLQGTAKKRIAEFQFETDSEKCTWRDELRLSWRAYCHAMDHLPGKAHWQTTQYLSLSAALNEATEPYLLQSATKSAKKDACTQFGPERAWTCGTLAELEMLRLYHDKERASEKEILTTVEQYCRELVNLTGHTSFQAQSTKRQFLRYLDWWQVESFSSVARRAITVLNGEG